MASYKQPCIHCAQLIDRDSRLCPKCGSDSPFRYSCPTCLRTVEKDDLVCSGCGRQLTVVCPACGKSTFTRAKCEACGASFMRPCTNSRCGVMQFFQNVKCTACGKKIKK